MSCSPTLASLLTGVLCFVAIAISKAGVPEERVIVTGQGRLAEIAYSSDLTASKVIIRTGGYSDFSRVPVFLIRSGHSTRINMESVLRGDFSEDPQLKPWDIIAIGTTLARLKPDSTQTVEPAASVSPHSKP